MHILRRFVTWTWKSNHEWYIVIKTHVFSRIKACIIFWRCSLHKKSRNTTSLQRRLIKSRFLPRCYLPAAWIFGRRVTAKNASNIKFLGLNNPMLVWVVVVCLVQLLLHLSKLSRRDSPLTIIFIWLFCTFFRCRQGPRCNPKLWIEFWVPSQHGNNFTSHNL